MASVGLPGPPARRHSARLDAEAKVKAADKALKALANSKPKAKSSARLVTYSRRVEPGPKLVRASRASGASGASGASTTLKRKDRCEDEDEDEDDDEDYGMDRERESKKSSAKAKAKASKSGALPPSLRPSALRPPSTRNEPLKEEDPPHVQEDWGPWLTSNRLNAKTAKTLKPQVRPRPTEAKSQKRKAAQAAVAAPGVQRDASNASKYSDRARAARVERHKGHTRVQATAADNGLTLHTLHGTLPTSVDFFERVSDVSDVGSAAADDYKTTLPPLPELCVEKVEELVKPQAEPPKDATDKVRSLALAEEAPETPGPGEALAGPWKKVVVCGDLNGDVQLLQRTLEEAGAADLAFAVGRFLPSKQEMSLEDFESRCAEMRMPCPVYFIESHSEELISRSLRSKNVVQLGPDIFYLGACGIQEVEGLMVAFLSGKYDPNNFRSVWGQGSFLQPNGHGDGCHYTEHAVKELKHQASRSRIDVLLTSEWPDKFWSTAAKGEAPNPVDRKHRSPAVQELFFELKPRYHVHASANVYRLRKAHQGPHAFVCTSIGLCDAPAPESDVEALQEDSRKWFHSMSMRSNCPEKFSLVDEVAPRKVTSQTRQFK